MTTRPALSIKLQTSPDLVEQVYNALLGAINDGTIKPGERITQEEVAKRFSVSRQPVLQALLLLKRDGFVEDAPGRGVRAVRMDADWIAAVYEVRGALDALAARLAANHRYQLDPSLLKRGRKAAAGKDIEAIIDADMKFHWAIYVGSGNPLIELSARNHWAHVRRVMRAVVQPSSHYKKVWDTHEKIAQAIASGKAEVAQALAQDHGSSASAYLVARFSELLDHQKVA